MNPNQMHIIHAATICMLDHFTNDQGYIVTSSLDKETLMLAVSKDWISNSGDWFPSGKNLRNTIMSGNAEYYGLDMIAHHLEFFIGLKQSQLWSKVHTKVVDQRYDYIMHSYRNEIMFENMVLPNILLILTMQPDYDLSAFFDRIDASAMKQLLTEYIGLYADAGKNLPKTLCEIFAQCSHPVVEVALTHIRLENI